MREIPCRLLGMTLLVLALVACGGARRTATAIPAPTAAGTWREVSSEHFIVWTNAAPERARALVRLMENLRQVVLGVSFFSKELPGKSFVIAFNDLEEVRQYVAPQFIAQAWSGSNVLLQPVIVLAASSLDDDKRIVTHELTHVIAHNVIRRQPDWFSEGIAGYFETVRLDEEGSKVDVGVPIEGRIAYLRRGGLIPVADVFGCATPACKDARFYSTTWALFTYLLTEHSALLRRYMQRLTEVATDQQAALWAETFPGLPASKLDSELATWLHYGSIRVMKYDVRLRDWPVTERSVTDADVLAAKGTLRYLVSPERGASAEIAQALALDPTHVIANMIEAVARKSISPDLARSITEAHPDDWRSWWLAWRAAENGADARAARDKACALLDANPAAIPIDQCSRDERGTFASDARQDVFKAAQPQLNKCIVKFSKPADLVDVMSVEADYDAAGNVTAARASIGSPATNACVEALLKTLVFPKGAAGTFRTTNRRTP